MTLPHRQLHFLEEYAVDGNGAAAAVRAGYSARSARQIANRLLTKDDIQQALKARQDEAAAKLAMTRQRMLGGLQEALATAREKRDPNAMIAALREIGKVCGFYAPETQRVVVSATGRGLKAKMEAMSDAELHQMAHAAIGPAH